MSVEGNRTLGFVEQTAAILLGLDALLSLPGIKLFEALFAGLLFSDGARRRE